MNGEDLRQLRERNGWSQSQLAEVISSALDRKCSSGQVSRWEKGTRPVPETISVFLNEVTLSQALRYDEPQQQTLEEQPGPAAGGDLPPAPDSPPSRQELRLPQADSVYARVCTEMWEMVATGVGLVGAATGSDTVRLDGAIIDAHKEELGKAYGKLAETNETFRRMLTNMTTSGAWLEVSFVTGKVVAEIARNHTDARPPRGGAVSGGNGTASLDIDERTGEPTLHAVG